MPQSLGGNMNLKCLHTQRLPPLQNAIKRTPPAPHNTKVFIPPDLKYSQMPVSADRMLKGNDSDSFPLCSPVSDGLHSLKMLQTTQLALTPSTARLQQTHIIPRKDDPS